MHSLVTSIWLGTVQYVGVHVVLMMVSFLSKMPSSVGTLLQGHALAEARQ